MKRVENKKTTMRTEKNKESRQSNYDGTSGMDEKNQEEGKWSIPLGCWKSKIVNVLSKKVSPLRDRCKGKKNTENDPFSRILQKKRWKNSVQGCGWFSSRFFQHFITIWLVQTPGNTSFLSSLSILFPSLHSNRHAEYTVAFSSYSFPSITFFVSSQR